MIPGKFCGPIEIEAGNILWLVGKSAQKWPDEWDQNEDRENEQKKINAGYVQSLPPKVWLIRLIRLWLRRHAYFMLCCHCSSSPLAIC